MNRNSFKNALKATREPSAVLSMLLGFTVVVLFAAAGMWWMAQRVAKNEVPAPITEPAPMSYIVQPGDSTWKLAERFYGDGMKYPHIELANSLAPDQELEVGQELKIPTLPATPTLEAGQPSLEAPAASAEPVAPVPTDTPIEPEQEPQPQSSTGNTTYTIRAGDSLWKIAVAKYGDGMQWVEIYDQNVSVVGANPDLIYPDIEIVLPQL